MKIYFHSLRTGGSHPVTGNFLVSYDPEVHRPDGSYGGGNLFITLDPSKARNFASFEEAIELLKSSPSCTCHALRPDGKPNRPLTAFNCELGRFAK